MGRYQGVPEGSFLVSGQDAAGRRWCEAVSSRLSGNAALAKAWARAYVRELEDRFVTGQGDVARLEKEILEVSLKFGVLCRFTSYVAVDRSEVVNEGGSRHGIVQPVEMPAGWSLEDRQLEELQRNLQAAVSLPLGAKASPMGRRAKKVMLARQVLQEQNADGRVSKKTQVAMDEAAHDAGLTPPAAPPPAAASPPESVDSYLMEFGSEPEPALDDADTSLDGSDFELTLNEKDAAANDESGSQVVALDEEEQEPTGTADKPIPAPTPSVPPREPLRLRGIGAEKPCSAPPPTPQAPGLLGKVFGLFKKSKGKQEAAVPTPDSLDLSAYRRRAADLLEPIKSGSGLAGSQRLHELGVLAVSLKALVEDLTSIGASPLEIHPLQLLLADLTALLEQPSPDETVVEKLWAQAEEVLRVFAGVPTEAPTASRREGFWK
jgi:hypothetical protein